MNMPITKKHTESTNFPQYFIINKSEPQYELIKKQLLDSPISPVGSSHYFIRAGSDNSCVCRIKAGNGTVLFYEILNHHQEGISDEDIGEALADPINSSPLPGYFYITPKIEERLQASRLPGHA
jgi:hypothetical protein